MNSSKENGIEKANEIGVDALKQIITLSSGILALSITFIKDALGESRPNALATFLIPLSWLLLIFSIVEAWMALVEVAKTLGKMDNQLLFVFDREVDDKKISDMLKAHIKRTIELARRAQGLFLLGIVTLGLFAMINMNLLFTTPLPSIIGTPQLTLTVTISPTITQIASPTAIPSPEYTPTP